MTHINLELLETQLSNNDYQLVKGIVATKGKNKGMLRASKPPVPQMTRVKNENAYFGYTYIYTNSEDLAKAQTAYIWRMVAFFVSPISQHQCMPCTADFDLPGTTSERDAMAKSLDDIVKIVIDSVPLSNQYGTVRWGRALGYNI